MGKSTSGPDSLRSLFSEEVDPFYTTEDMVNRRRDGRHLNIGPLLSHMQDDIPRRPEHLPAGYDENDPYEGEDLSKYPVWWRDLVEEFREHGLRPYRPPRFLDGELTLDCVSSLESELSVDIQFKTTNAEEDEWNIYIDGDVVGSVPRTRMGDGYTLYRMTSSEFEEVVQSAVK